MLGKPQHSQRSAQAQTQMFLTGNTATSKGKRSPLEALLEIVTFCQWTEFCPLHMQHALGINKPLRNTRDFPAFPIRQNFSEALHGIEESREKWFGILFSYENRTAMYSYSIYSARQSFLSVQYTFHPVRGLSEYRQIWCSNNNSFCSNILNAFCLNTLELNENICIQLMLIH